MTNDFNINDYNWKVYERIFKNTSERTLITSPYLRFIELLHLFSIDFKELFSEYIIIREGSFDKELLSPTRSRFTDDATRYDNNAGFLADYFCAFQNCLSQRQHAPYNETIYPLLCELETIIKESDSTLINDYNNYKKFFSCFFNKANSLLKAMYTSDDPAFYLITLLQLQTIGVSLFWGNALVQDMINDYRTIIFSNEYDDQEFWLTYIEKLCNFKSHSNSSPHVFLDSFSSFKENWNFIQKLSHNEDLQNYLFNVLLGDNHPDIDFINRSLDSLNRLPPVSIIKRCMKYAYLLNYTPVIKARASAIKAVLSFYEKKLQDDYLTVVFCCAHIVKLSCLSAKALEELYIYACLIDI